MTLETKINYWTCFANSSRPLSIHITHKFLGELEKDNISDVIEKIKKCEGAEAFPAKFETIEYFGQDSDIRVLTNRDLNFHPCFDYLRYSLGKYREDDFPEYIPHITTKEDEHVALLFDRYYLCCNDNIVFSLGLKFNNLTKNF